MAGRTPVITTENKGPRTIFSYNQTKSVQFDDVALVFEALQAEQSLPRGTKLELVDGRIIFTIS